MFLIQFGCDPNWLLDLDLLAFNSLAETAMRLHAQQQAEQIHRDRLVAHDEGKNLKEHVKNLQRQASGKSNAPDSDDLISDLTMIGALK